jgi:hypothetical protein
MMQNVRYTAAIFDEDGTDLGPVDVSSAQDDEHARDLAKQAGMKWLTENGLDRASIRVTRNGYGLPVVEVHI